MKLSAFDDTDHGESIGIQMSYLENKQQPNTSQNTL